MSSTLAGRYPSPLRYPGGKGKVANFIKLLFLENDLLGSEYVEPYAGGASVALSLLFDDYASHIHINDINRSVYSFWATALNDTEQLCKLIWDTPVTVEEWRRQKSIQKDPDATGFELAFSTFFLNRTNRSGIISRGGMIGGNQQTGEWKIGARYNKEELCRRVKKIARFRSRITVTQLDALELLGELATEKPERLLVYLDPPYYVKGEGLYDNFYQHKDHRSVASQIQRMGCSWVVSYDAAPEIISMYRTNRSLRYSLTYSASEYHMGSEVMFFSRDLVIPATTSAAGITGQQVDTARRTALLI